jgi:hypothetical protein
VELELLLLDRKCEREEWVGVRKHEIECRGRISCALTKMIMENDVYMCWGEADKVELELEPLNRKCEKGGAGWGHPAKTYPNAFALPASPTTVLSTAFRQQMLILLR